MQSKQEDNLIFVRLFPGEEVMESLEKICREYEVETAVVLSGLGQLGEFELGFFKEKGDYAPETLSEPHELVSLNGNVSKQEDEYVFHLHAVLSDEYKKVKGGHFMKGVVSITAEIVLLRTDLKIKRILEDETGLKGLFLE